MKLFIFRHSALSLQIQENLLRLELYIQKLIANKKDPQKEVLVFVENLALPLVINQNQLEFSHDVRLVALKFQELIRKHNIDLICCSRSLLEWGYANEWVVVPEDKIGVHDLFNLEKYDIDKILV
ncbi:hypothetical protein CJP74_02745 [Psittacicella melopsittaci]|uniref:Uncharacterized protein n=1 Tax=Psittacicella melopsittaci TaxID=2028576 RepID=A0A3A1Y6Z9_9GAMM|nr:hypothetical protein [Psittacicella melopsittaci]RIY33060.1 hypothetical protein CJP74_02745 [Psittacicella melopsittaci]